MRLAIAASVLACTSVHALSDSSPSPFVLFSTAKLASSPEVDQLQTSGQVLSIAKELLGSCPTTRYFLVSQPNIHAIDVRGDSGCKMPNLCRVIAHESVGSRFSVSAVMGQIATEQLSDHIRAACLGEGRQSKIEEMRLRALPPMRERERRMDMLADNDYEIGRLLETAQAEGDYTVVFFSDPNETRAYEADFIEPVHMDLKRQSGPLPIGQRAANASSDLPLFEKYQFFTPGIFMGLMALFFMLSILTVGLKALASLQVSYGAFDKEMGPAAQKKQM